MPRVPDKQLQLVERVDQLYAQRAGSFVFQDRANGSTTTIVPEPPAGYLHVVHHSVFANAAAALAAIATLRDGIGPQYIVNVPAVQTVALITGVAIVEPGGGALDLVVSGAGGTCSILGEYWRVPKPTGFFSVSTVLTNAFQAVNAAPVSGINVLAWLTATGANITLSAPAYLVNADTASATVILETVRGAATVISTGAALTAGNRGAISAVPAALAVGDTLRARLNVAPVVAGSVVLRTYWQNLEAA